ncbi:MAG: molybdopterin-dependent oxidoreductase, partial [Candidatus Sulfotelmatobacter sp.]
ISEGMVVTTQSDTVKQARRAMLEFVLQNHPLDCPVCDAGGQCELQDATLSYGPGESRLIDPKNHKDEQQWSPIVYFDRPRCIMCYRCVRVCGEGMDVWALGIANRNSAQLIVPNKGDYLECEECGMCIDICPVGALTSGPYRYKTRPWEMKHVATICTHCADGCTATLAVRPSETGMEIVRGSNRDKSGINGDFLCFKGRYAFDFTAHAERLKQPLIRKDGRLVPTSWEEAFATVAGRFRQIRDEFGGKTIGVIGSTRTTNEENYLLQKIARVVLGTNNIDHHRTADFPAFFRALADKPGTTASMKDVFEDPAILLIGSDPTYQHPLLAWQMRNNVRLHHARLYLINSRVIKLTRQATCFARVDEGSEERAVAFLGGDDSARDKCSANPADRNDLTALREKISTEKSLIVVCGAELQGRGIARLVRAMAALIPSCKWVCLGDYANSRGASDMGLYPDLLPGYTPLSEGGEFREKWDAQFPQELGLNLLQILEASKNGLLKALYVVGSNPVARYQFDPFALRATFLVVQDLFLTETAQLADVVLPATSAYEKSGTFTNTCGDLQRLKKAGEVAGPKSDLEIIARVAQYMAYPIEKLVRRGEGIRADAGQSRGAQSGEVDRQAVWTERQDLEPRFAPFDPNAVLDEIQSVVPAYRSRHADFSGLTRLATLNRAAGAEEQLITSTKNDLFSSGSLGRYCSALKSVIESHLLLPYEPDSGDRELFAEPREWNDPGSVRSGS